MKLSVYIRNRLWGDIVVLGIIGATIYLAMYTFNENKLEPESNAELILLDDSASDGVG